MPRKSSRVASSKVVEVVRKVRAPSRSSQKSGTPTKSSKVGRKTSSPRKSTIKASKAVKTLPQSRKRERESTSKRKSSVSSSRKGSKVKDNKKRNQKGRKKRDGKASVRSTNSVVSNSSRGSTSRRKRARYDDDVSSNHSYSLRSRGSPPRIETITGLEFQDSPFVANEAIRANVGRFNPSSPIQPYSNVVRRHNKRRNYGHESDDNSEHIDLDQDNDFEIIEEVEGEPTDNKDNLLTCIKLIAFVGLFTILYLTMKEHAPKLLGIGN